MTDSREDHDTPWYRRIGPQLGPHPFRLRKRTAAPTPSDVSFNAVSAFPWQANSLVDADLWPGDERSETRVQCWKDMIAIMYGAIAIAGGTKVVVSSPLRPQWSPSIQFQLPSEEGTHITCIAWTVSFVMDSFVPRVVFGTSNALLYIFDVLTGQISGCLSGHGGGITSIGVHPKNPHIICSTSRDFTTRIYDLTRPSRSTEFKGSSRGHRQPPNKASTLSGTPFGQHSTNPEGWGAGACIAVLVGGRSGGHEAAVMCATFHALFPVIATAGLDRTVKIWCIPPTTNANLGREDKPLFSSSLIHNAGVLSVTWLSQDVLLSHSIQPFIRESEEADFKEDSATVTVWRWLGVDRFFPPSESDKPFRRYLRGCASDYQESASFRVVATHFLPPATKCLRVFQSAHHDPLVVLAHHSSLMIFNVTDMSPRPIPNPPQLVFDPSPENHLIRGVSSENRDEPSDKVLRVPPLTRQTTDFTHLRGWTLWVEGMFDILACELSMDGEVIFAVGENEGIAVWSP